MKRCKLKRMMVIFSLACIYFASFGSFAIAGIEGNKLKTDNFEATINKGFFTSFKNPRTGTNYILKGQKIPILQCKVDGKMYKPDDMRWNRKNNTINLVFGRSGFIVEVKVTVKPAYLKFEVIDIKKNATYIHDSSSIELVQWGPYMTNLQETVGKIIGVVRNKDYAVGLQSLNPKTIGGTPWRNDDGNSEANTAIKKGGGSSISAYCRNRSEPRIITNFWRNKSVSPALDDGEIIGSKIALFGCPAKDVLATISEIEVGERLPHPLVDGEWIHNRNDYLEKPYLIVPFGESNVESAIFLTKKLGWDVLYHPNAFSEWGHFKFQKGFFPNGKNSFKACVEKANKAGVPIVGFHTLSNFIHPTDKYVSPIPDSRLAKVGSTTLLKNIDKNSTEIPIADPTFFAKSNVLKKRMNFFRLRTVVIGKELVRYDRVSEKPPWKLLNCERGAWGTNKQAHKVGSEVAALFEHPYRVFFGNLELNREIARRLADLWNETGARMISFDGLEGNKASGHGAYACADFVQTFYNHLKPEIKKGPFHIHTSLFIHYNQHAVSRKNAGEPHHDSFRKSQTEYRIKRQKQYHENLRPNMLGWFHFFYNTTYEDLEWCMNLSAGFDAGFGLLTRLHMPTQIYKEFKSGNSSYLVDIVNMIKQWGDARLSGAIPEDIKPDLKDPSKEFHLEVVGKGKWNIQPVNTYIQPSSKNNQSVTLNNPYAKQQMAFFVQNQGKQAVSNLTLTIAGKKIPLYSGNLSKNQCIRLAKGASEIIVYSRKRKMILSHKIDPKLFIIPKGKTQVLLSWNGSASGNGLRLEFRTYGKQRLIKSKK